MPNLEPQINDTALLQERAVVLGCGVAGLAAAAALRNHYEEVVVIERDSIPERPESRRGVPQDEQLHNLLTCAQNNLEQLMPGFLNSLIEAGAGNARVGDETHVHELGIHIPERDLGLRLMSAWRPVIEHVAREKLLDEGRVAIEGIGRAIGLRLSGEDVVTGAVIDTEMGTKVIAASLVVDATGTGSNAFKWFREHEQQTPPTDELRVNQWYVSTLFKRPAEQVENNDFWLTFPGPAQTRGGLISPIGNEQWYVSLSGRSTDQPPRTVDEVREYAKTLDDDLSISSLIDHAEPQSKPNLFRKTNASMRRYDLLERPLQGFLPIGDSIASLNPLFGQGMSVASWQASELDTLLGSHRLGELDIEDLTPRYLSRALIAARSAWDLGQVVDQTIAGSSDAELEEVKIRYKALSKLIEEDPDLHRLYVSIWHLIEPASALQAPNITDRLNIRADEIISSSKL